MKGSVLTTLFYNMIGDVESAPRFFSATTVTQLFDRAMSELYADTNILDGISPIACTAEVGIYDLPADCSEVHRVAYNGIRLRTITQARLNAESASWVNEIGEPKYYYLDGLDKQVGVYPKPGIASETASGGEYGVYIGSGDTEFGVYIDPAISGGLIDEHGVYVGGLGGKYLEVYYSASPDVYNAGEKPQVPLWGVYYLLWHMLAEAYLIGLPDADMEASVSYRLLAEQVKDRITTRAANPLNKVWRKRAGRLPSVADPRLRWGEIT